MPENFRKSILAKLQLPLFMLSFFLKSLSLCGKVDVLHAQWIPSGVIAALVKKITGKPVVLYVHGATVFLGLFKSLTGFALRNADFVFFNSSYTKRKALEIAQVENCAVLSPGIDVQRFSGNRGKGFVRKKHGIATSAPVVFSLGRLVERKGFEYLIRAMQSVKSNAVLVLAGSGPMEKELKDLTRRLGLENRVVFAGRIPAKELPLYYADCNVFVLPAIVDSKGDTEGLGMVLAEAMASGKPVIASRVGGIPDVVVDKVNGFLVEQKKPKELAQKINTLLGNSARRQRMGKAGRAFANKKFSWDRVCGEMLRVHTQLLEKPR